ncbi:MAG TPA: hypothetical protein VGM78_07805 [Ilumatobacteraceae bacterium]|jgi:hypothetical protein
MTGRDTTPTAKDAGQKTASKAGDKTGSKSGDKAGDKAGREAHEVLEAFGAEDIIDDPVRPAEAKRAEADATGVPSPA